VCKAVERRICTGGYGFISGLSYHFLFFLHSSSRGPPILTVPAGLTWSTAARLSQSFFVAIASVIRRVGFSLPGSAETCGLVCVELPEPWPIEGFCRIPHNQQAAQTLAHESSHMHLFGVALDSPLVLNDDNARYKSRYASMPAPWMVSTTRFMSLRACITLSRACWPLVFSRRRRSKKPAPRA